MKIIITGIILLYINIIPINIAPTYAVEEEWEGEVRSYPKLAIFPPWGRGDGRGTKTCLYKKHFPYPLVPYYSHLCGERAQENSYSTPKIRVRGQQCNALFCWTTNNLLKWDGQCVTLGGGYGFPLHRMCARIANPENIEESIPADPGYTRGIHLNYYGERENDELTELETGEKVLFDKPKICLYRDPAFLSLEDGFDLMDLNPNKQSMHRTKEVHHVIRVIILITDSLINLSVTGPKLVNAIVSALGGDGEGVISSVFSVIADILGFFIKIIELFGQLIIIILEYIGQINRAVDDYIYGCSEIEIGPYPPPFLPKIGSLKGRATVHKICQRGSDGKNVLSTESNECVDSKIRNNAIHNSIRVSYDNFIPFCTKDDEDPMQIDHCVKLNNNNHLNMTTKELYNINKGIIKKCTNNDKSEGVCVETMINHVCNSLSEEEADCREGFRFVYALKIGSYYIPNVYYKHDVEDCNALNNNGICQQVWGINSGEYIDISLNFNDISNNFLDKATPLEKNFSLYNLQQQEKKLTASIANIETERVNNDEIFIQGTNQICVFIESNDSSNLVGCIERAKINKPELYECNSHYNCSSTYKNPKFVVSITEGEDKLTTITQPKSIHNKVSAKQGRDVANLAGYEFNSFITDKSFIRAPFDGPGSANPSSILGTYLSKKDNTYITKYEEIVNNDYNAIYLFGLEYKDGFYVRGGVYGCIDNTNNNQCPIDPTMCVLSQLTNTDVVNCSEFNDKIRKYPDIKVCSTEDIEHNCNKDSIDTITKEGKEIINIKNCTIKENNMNYYCYTSPNNQEICNVSYDPMLRKYPLPPKTKTDPAILNASEYYDTKIGAPMKYLQEGNTNIQELVTGSYSNNTEDKLNQSGTNYNKNKYGLRNKTPEEMGMCVKIATISKCEEISSNSKSALEDNGNAFWTSAEIGEISNGTCAPGYTHDKSLGELKRYCMYTNNGLAKFEEVKRNLCKKNAN